MLMAIINGTPGDDPDLFGTPENDEIRGFAGNDVALGLDGDDRLFGGTGNDRVAGGSGGDRAFGDDGDDVLVGGLGVDQLAGGAGADVFEFGSVANATEPTTGVGKGNRDRIVDFSRGEGDQIDVQFIDADLTVDDNQTFSFVSEADIGILGTGELGFFETAGRTILHANTDADPGSNFEIQLGGVDLGLTADDFIL
jgi:serralysin